MACNAPWMSATTFQTAPPLKSWGDCVISCQISLNLPFHTSSTFSKFWTTQLSDTQSTSFFGAGPSLRACPMCSDSSAKSVDDKGQNLFCKSYDNAARQGEKTVGTLGRVVALEGKAHLDDAPAQQDQAHGPNQTKDELRQVVDNGERVAASSGGQQRASWYSSPSGPPPPPGNSTSGSPFSPCRAWQAVPGVLLVLFVFDDVHCVLPL